MTVTDKILILIGVLAIWGSIIFICWRNFKYFLAFLRWFLSTFNKDYTPKGEFHPDFKKILSFCFGMTVCYICMHVTLSTGFNAEAFYGLLVAIGGLVGANIAPLFNSKSSQIKMAELQASTNQNTNQDNTKADGSEQSK